MKHFGFFYPKVEETKIFPKKYSSQFLAIMTPSLKVETTDKPVWEKLITYRQTDRWATVKPYYFPMKGGQWVWILNMIDYKNSGSDLNIYKMVKATFFKTWLVYDLNERKTV